MHLASPCFMVWLHTSPVGLPQNGGEKNVLYNLLRTGGGSTAMSTSQRCEYLFAPHPYMFQTRIAGRKLCWGLSASGTFQNLFAPHFQNNLVALSSTTSSCIVLITGHLLLFSNQIIHSCMLLCSTAAGAVSACGVRAMLLPSFWCCGVETCLFALSCQAAADSSAVTLFPRTENTISVGDYSLVCQLTTAVSKAVLSP